MFFVDMDKNKDGMCKKEVIVSQVGLVGNFFFYKFPLDKFVYKSHLAERFPCLSSTLKVLFPVLARHLGPTLNLLLNLHKITVLFLPPVEDQGIIFYLPVPPLLYGQRLQVSSVPFFAFLCPLPFPLTTNSMRPILGGLLLLPLH